MTLKFLLLSLVFLPFAAAIDFTDYAPQTGVQDEFKDFLNAYACSFMSPYFRSKTIRRKTDGGLPNRLVTPAEDPTATTAYTDFFPADGMQTTLTLHCVGATRITECKQYFLPVDGSKSLIVSHMSSLYEQVMGMVLMFRLLTWLILPSIFPTRPLLPTTMRRQRFTKPKVGLKTPSWVATAPRYSKMPQYFAFVFRNCHRITDNASHLQLQDAVHSSQDESVCRCSPEPITVCGTAGVLVP